MYAWSFPVRTHESLARFFRALGKNRYRLEVEARVHWAVDAALHGKAAPSFDVTSRDPQLWRVTTMAEALEVLAQFWISEESRRHGEQLQRILREAGIPKPTHAPFESDADEPPHPELLLLDWSLLPVDALDASQHAGALRAMAGSGDAADASEPVHIEGPTLAEPELVAGYAEGQLPQDVFVWADGPYSYCDYLFRGVARAAKLPAGPVGYRDV